MIRQTPQLLAVLAALHAGANHGLAVMHRTGLKSGTVYPILCRIEQAGWARSTWAEPESGPGRPPRRIYHLTSQAPGPVPAPAGTAPVAVV